MKQKMGYILLIALMMVSFASCGRQIGAEQDNPTELENSKGDSYDAAKEAVLAGLREHEAEEADAVDLEILYDGSIFGANVVGYQGEGNRATITCNDDYFCYAVTSVGKSAFENCATLRFVQFIEGNIEEFGECAFRNCGALEEITIPFKTKTIGARAFENCGKLSSLRILGSAEIGEYAFSGCTGLTEVIIPPDTQIIHARAFDGCTALETVTLRGEDTVIEDGVFDNCPNLKDIIQGE